MAIRNKIPHIKLKRISKKEFAIVVVVGLVTLFLGAVFGVVVMFFGNELKLESSINVWETPCVKGRFFFPDSYTINTGSGDIKYEFRNFRTVFGHVYYANELCFLTEDYWEPESSFAVSLKYFNADFLKKELVFNSGKLPEFTNDRLAQESPKLALNNTVVFTSEIEDTYFNYTFDVENVGHVECVKNQLEIVCPADSLKTDQGKKYRVVLLRTSPKGNSTTVCDKQVETVSALKVVKTSVKEGGTIYNPNENIKIEFNKVLANVTDLSLEKRVGDKYAKVDFTSTQNDSSILIKQSAMLEPNTRYVLRIGKAEGVDGGVLNQSYALNFSVTAGPKVASHNVPSSKAAYKPSFSIKFDQNIDAKQDFKKLISLSNGAGYSVKVASANSITVSLTSNLKICETVSLNISKDLKSYYGISGASKTALTFRTQCAQYSTLGYSVQGRAISAVRFGSGATNVVFLAAMHGSETNTVSLMTEFVNYLEKNGNKIPLAKSVWLILNTNPDGTAAKKRFNANNVDLNRNFATANWKSETYLTGGQVFPLGGGTAPFSEPESRVIRDFILQKKPVITFSYHSKGAYVLPNLYGSSATYGRPYSKKSGYLYVDESNYEGSFDYEITGTMENWAGENGYPVVVVELSTSTSSESSRNLSAMWDVVMR